MRIALIGSGNVATQLGRALKAAGEEIIQVWSRSMEHASALATELEVPAVSSYSAITPKADLYIISVNDDAISSVASQLPVRDKILVHTSGSTGMEILKGCSPQIGVLYPLQTFTKTKTVDFTRVPLAIEGNDPAVLEVLGTLGSKISQNVIPMDSAQRRALHVAAVFACNFTNHLYALASGLMQKNGLDFGLLRPLIRETADKVQTFLPLEVQTGPAVRGDQQTINKHLALLQDSPELQELYRRLSQSIVNLHK